MADVAKKVLYHGDCPDGIGGAYAAWKKFGDAAAYVPLFDRTVPPEGLAGAEVYLIDFSYPIEVLQGVQAQAKRLVVLDHHLGAREAVCTVQEHVFDNDRSGAHIAWDYFHPNVPLPRLLAYIEDDDLWRHALPHSREITAYLAIHLSSDLASVDMLAEAFKKDAELEWYVRAGSYYNTYFHTLCRSIADRAAPVLFEGYTVYAANCTHEFTSEVGHLLATEHPPFGIIWYLHEEQWRISLRGDGSVDLAALAQRYGGNGHHDAAAFRLPYLGPLPFTYVPRAR